MSFFRELPGDWCSQLNFLEPVFKSLEEKLTHEANTGAEILPSRKNVFRALSVACEDARVVIVGQDPYPNPHHAMGLSFSVPRGTRPLPASLVNILKEIRNDIGEDSQAINGDLTPWCEQGVVLLNRTLTVRAGDSGSHQKIGWQKITDEIVRRYAHHGAIGILWGRSAQELTRLFPAHRVITGVHPSPLSAHRGFFGSKPFSRANHMLEISGKPAIRW